MFSIHHQSFFHKVVFNPCLAIVRIEKQYSCPNCMESSRGYRREGWGGEQNRMSGSQDVQLKIFASGIHCFKHVTESINTILITWSCKTNIVYLPGFTFMVLFDCRTLFTQAPPSTSLWDSRTIGVCLERKTCYTTAPKKGPPGPTLGFTEHLYS